jgi:hypothetical protein
LEYASEVWDYCGQTNSDRLEKVQLEAARIVTGLPSFASIHSIYIDVSSAKRRPRPTISSVISFMKIKNIKGPNTDH